MLLNLQSSRGLGISRETDMAGCAERQVSNTVAATALQSRVGEPCWAAEAEVAPGGGGRLGWSRIARTEPTEDSGGMHTTTPF